MWDVVVVGAGAAGLLAATRSAERGRRTLLLEKNRKAGVKILMSGGTRCNLTQATDRRGIVEAFGAQGKFLHSPLAALGPAELVALVEAEGVATKVEPTGKVFPISDKAADVLMALLRRLRRSSCEFALAEPLIDIATPGAVFRLTTAQRTIDAAKVIIATGGKSYPGCGTAGDGYAWAKALGHSVITPRPALTPVTTNDRWARELQGVTLDDVSLQVVERNDGNPGAAAQKTATAQRRGGFLFTHFGLSGPVVLDVSRAITSHARPESLDLVCDFLPSWREDEVDQRLRSEIASSGNKRVAALLATWLPKRLAESLVVQAGLSRELSCAEFASRDRRRLIDAVKRQRIAISGTRGFKKAEVTAGGVALDEVDSRNMQSRMLENLFLAGEILDLDGPIGGYNFQAAFSTGLLAGESV